MATPIFIPTNSTKNIFPPLSSSCYFLWELHSAYPKRFHEISLQSWFAFPLCSVILNILYCIWRSFLHLLGWDLRSCLFVWKKKNCYDFKGPSLILHIMPSNKIVTQKIPSMQIYFPSLKLFSLLYRIFKFCVSFIFTFAFVTKAFDLISEESLPRTRSRFYTWGGF